MFRRRLAMSKIQFILGIGLACAIIGIFTGCIGAGTQDVEVAAAKGVLNIYLGYAAKQDKSAMWDTLHPDSKNTYRNFNDFASNNGITNYQDIYNLNNWNIESADKISSWKIYSNVVACKVTLNYKLDTMLSILEKVFIGGVVPDKEEITTTIFLIKANDQWAVFSENSSGSAPEDTSTSPNETQPESLPTTPSQSDIPTISAKELISEFDTKLLTESELEYLDQVIRVTGVVQSISSSIVDLTYSGGLDWVCCNFNSSNSEQLMELSEGDEVTIQGTLKDESIFVPVLVDCKVVE